MTKSDWEKEQYFQMMLVNLRDDFILGRRTQIDADAKALQEAWQDLTDKQKKSAQPQALKMIKLFSDNLHSVGGNKFLEEYRKAFHEEQNLPEPQQFNALRIFKEMLAELEGME